MINLQTATIKELKAFCNDMGIAVDGDRRKKETFIQAIENWTVESEGLIDIDFDANLDKIPLLVLDCENNNELETTDENWIDEFMKSLEETYKNSIESRNELELDIAVTKMEFVVLDL